MNQNTRHEYVYTDESENPLFKVHRDDDAKAEGRKNAFRVVNCATGRSGLNGARRVLYRLPELLTADVVVVVEGEKKCDALREATGLAVTTAFGGRYGMAKADLAPLVRRDLHIVVWPDALGLREHDNWTETMYARLRNAYDELKWPMHIGFVRTPENVVERGWDCADAIAEGRDLSALLDNLINEEQWREAAGFNRRPFLPVPVARDIEGGLGHLISHAGTVYRWCEKKHVWIDLTDHDLRAFASRALGEYARAAHISDVVDQLKARTHSADDPFAYDRDPYRIYAANGDLRLKHLEAQYEAGEIVEGVNATRDSGGISEVDGRFYSVETGTSGHDVVREYHRVPARWQMEIADPDHETYTRIRLPVAYRDDESYDLPVIARSGYTPDQPCPAFMKYLGQVFHSDTDQPEKIRLVQQLFGYCLIRDTKNPMLVFLHGDGSSGKSTLLEILTALLGPENVANVGLKKLGERFGLAPLVGKIANIIHEVGEGTVLDDETLKLLADARTVAIEEKGKDIRSAHLSVRQVYASNHVPVCRDLTRGFLRRVRILTFNQNFEGREDKGLSERITENPLEMAGILRWAVAGALDLLESGFVNPPSSQARLAEWQGRWDSVQQFVEDECVIEQGAVSSGRHLYARYSHWTAGQGMKPVAYKNFKTRLERIASVEYFRNARYRGFKGIRHHTEEPAEKVGVDLFRMTNGVLSEETEARLQLLELRESLEAEKSPFH